MIIVPILTTSIIHFSLKCWENVLFELGGLSTGIFDSRTSTGGCHYFGIVINAHALTRLTLKSWTWKKAFHSSCSLRLMYNSEMVTSGWRSWIKNVVLKLSDRNRPTGGGCIHRLHECFENTNSQLSANGHSSGQLYFRTLFSIPVFTSQPLCIYAFP